MHVLLILLMALTLLAVLVTLGAGIVGLFRGASPEKSNRLMSYRVVFQAVAIVLFVVFIWLYRNS